MNQLDINAAKYRPYLSIAMMRRIISILSTASCASQGESILDQEIISKLQLVILKNNLGLNAPAYEPLMNPKRQRAISTDLGMDIVPDREMEKARILSPEDELEYKRLEILAESGTLPPEDEPRFNELFMRRNELS